MTRPVSALVDQMLAVIEASFDPRWGEAWNARQLRDCLAMPWSHVYLIDEDARRCDPVRGYAAGFLLARAAPGEEEILLIAVRPEFRRRRLARRLIEWHEADARARGATKLFLEMRCNNPAQHLYRACGFRPIGRRKDYYTAADGSRIDAVTFALDLSE